MAGILFKNARVFDGVNEHCQAGMQVLVEGDCIREVSAIWLGLLSALAFAAFIFRQSRAARPIIDFAVFRLPGFAILNLVSVLANLAAFSVWLLVPYYLVLGLGLTRLSRRRPLPLSP